MGALFLNLKLELVTAKEKEGIDKLISRSREGVSWKGLTVVIDVDLPFKKKRPAQLSDRVNSSYPMVHEWKTYFVLY